MPVVDAHTHFIPIEFVDFLRRGEGPASVRVVDREGKDPLVEHSNGLAYPVFEMFRDPAAKIAQLDRDGIDFAVSSIVPSLFLYDADPADTLRVHRVINDAGKLYAEQSGGRIAVLATVPLNDPGAAVDELHRACGELGLAGVEIGPSVGDVMVDHPELDPFFGAAEELDVTVMLHPYLNMIAAPGPDLAGFHLGNVAGNPYETFVAACRLVVGGVFDRHPNLRIQLSHAGGYFPFQMGRLQHAYGSREETRSVAQRPPLEYLGNFLFDSIIFEPAAMAFLIDAVGADKVVYGTDIPFDMADERGLETLRAVTSTEVFERVAGGNAIDAYGLVS
jgi:aminocarboxymuconate-semialdehyde decarboxylase